MPNLENHKSANVQRIALVRDLIESLRAYDGNLPVLATWEGIYVIIEVRQDCDGTVLIDADQKRDDPCLT